MNKQCKAIIIFMLLAGILGCSSDNVKIADGQYLRPYIPIAILQGGQDGVPLVDLRNGEYHWTYLTPGIYQFTGMFDYSGDYRGNGIPSRPIQMKAGETYYFQVTQQPARAIQDITIMQRADFSDMAAYTSTQGQPPKNSQMSLVYFYYRLPYSFSPQNPADTNTANSLQKKLGCSDQEMRDGTCQ
jgi:hypothetical protein